MEDTKKEEYTYTIEEVEGPTKKEIHDSDMARANVEDNGAQQKNGDSKTENQEQEHPNDEKEKQYDYKVRFKLPNGAILREMVGNTRDIPEGITLAELAYALRKNGLNFELLMLDKDKVHQVEQLETTELSTKVRRPRTQSQDVIEAGDNKEEQKQLPGKVPGKRGMGCLPILILPPLVVGLLSINNVIHMHEEVITKTKDLEITISGDRNPGQEYGELGAYYGQEAMTNRYIMGDGKNSYDMNKQASIEQGATETYMQYEKTTETIKEAIGIINNSNSTQDQIEQALKTLEEQFGIRVEIREEVRPQIEEMAEGFNKAAEAHPDSRTAAEEQIVKGIADEFYRDTSAENTDLGELQDLNDRVQKGEKIGNWKVTKNEYGDYVITAENVIRVVKVEEYRGLKAILHELQEALGISKDAQNTTENIIENGGDER